MPTVCVRQFGAHHCAAVGAAVPGESLEAGVRGHDALCWPGARNSPVRLPGGPVSIKWKAFGELKIDQSFKCKSNVM